MILDMTISHTFYYINKVQLLLYPILSYLNHKIILFQYRLENTFVFEDETQNTDSTEPETEEPAASEEDESQKLGTHKLDTLCL